MIALILFIIVGVLFSLFATNNTGMVTIAFGQFITYSTPLYIALLAAFILGLVFASIFYLIKSVTLGFTLRRQTKEKKEAKTEIAELTKRIHKLQLENEALKTKNGVEDVDTDSI